MRAKFFLCFLISGYSFGQIMTEDNTVDKVGMSNQIEGYLNHCGIGSYNSPLDFKKSYDNIIFNICEIGDEHFVGPYKVISKTESSTPTLLTQDVFFTFDGELVYARETELRIDRSLNDTLTWKCQYFFQKGKLVDYISLGHGKTEDQSWIPEAIIEKYLINKKKFDY